MKKSLLILSSIATLAFTPKEISQEYHPEEEKVLTATNAYRESKKRGILEMDSFLCVLAREHSENMASGKVGFGHRGFDRRAEKIRETLHSGHQAENVYYSSEAPDGEEAVKAWIKSKGHRQNMLGKEYRRIGIGVATGKKGSYFTQIFSD